MLIKMRPMHILTLTALTALTACGQGRFLGGLYGNKEAPESSQITDGEVEALGDSSVTSGTGESKSPIETNQRVGEEGSAPPAAGNDAGPEQKINEPVMVGGAFLVCANDANIPHAPQQNGIGCRFEDIDSKRVAVSNDVQAAFLLYDVLNVKIETTITRSPENSNWTWTMPIPIASAPGARVEVLLSGSQTSATRSTNTAITGVGTVSPDIIVNNIPTFFLGDSNLTYQESERGCKDLTATSGLARSRIVTIPFKTFNEKQAVAINLIDVDGAQLLSNSNARVVRGGIVVSSLVMGRGDNREYIMPTFTTEIGVTDYKLEITSAKYLSGVDDFCIRKIEIKSKSAITLSPIGYSN